MSSLTINIASNKQNDVLTADIVNSGKDASAIVNNLGEFLAGCVGGVNDYRMDIYSSATSPVAATAALALTHANVTNGDTVTIGGTVITAATSGNGTTSFTIGANATADAIAFAACINANATLSPHILASTPVAGTVTLTARLKGSIANLITLATSDATAFAITAFASGAGGPVGAAVNFNNTTTIA